MSDEQTPEPEAAEDDSAEAAELLRTATGVEPVETVPAGQGAEVDAGTKVLGSLLSRSPFMDLFCSMADRSFEGPTTAARVAQARVEWPRFHVLCRYLDLSLRLVVAVAIVVIALAVAYKTVAPLPDLQLPGSN